MIKKTLVGHSKVNGKKVYKLDVGKFIQGYVLESGTEIKAHKIKFLAEKEDTKPEPVEEEKGTNPFYSKKL